MTLRSIFVVCLAGLTLLLGACSGKGHAKKRPAPEPAAFADGAPLLKLNQVQSWACQCQGLNQAGAVDALAASTYDMIVIDPVRTEAVENGEPIFDTKGAVDTLRSSLAHDGVHHKLVLARVNIGEAESRRLYWNWQGQWEPNTSKPRTWPRWIVGQDPDGWREDFPVAFWSPEWKEIVLHGRTRPFGPQAGFVSLVDEVLRDGFDGICLDGVGMFDEESVAAYAKKGAVDPAAEMFQFLIEIHNYARQRHPGFLLLQQNGAGLITRQPALPRVIDGIIQEGLWFTGKAAVEWPVKSGHDQPRSEEETQRLVELLKRFQSEGKPVFLLEYAVTNARAVYSQAQEYGFVPYCSRSALSRLTTTPPGR